MKPLFLLLLPTLAFGDPDALALPPQSEVARFAELKKFLDRYPGEYEFHFSDIEAPDGGVGWFKTPFVWEGMKIYARRMRRAA